MKILITLSAVFISLISFGQRISEDDLPISLVAKYYYHYPNAEEQTWTKVVKGGEERFNVEFTFEGKDYSVSYNKQAWRLTERIKLTSKEVPATTFDFVTRRFSDDKFKITAFTQLNTFENLRPADSFYSMEVKVKKDLYVLYFDEKLEHLDGSSTQVLSGL